ncbi:MAG: S24 family peptidase [Thermodesulfobacteriota bacterium]|nr:S24 family peptidase [Thermodesulfobacteriota bacterium]
MTTLPFDTFYQNAATHLGVQSQSHLASLLGIHRSAVTQAKQRNVVPDLWVFRLAERFDVAPALLAPSWQGDAAESEAVTAGRRLKRIPMVKARLHAGAGSFEVDASVEDFYGFSPQWLRRMGNPETMVLMDVVGDSMAPVIQEGDTVLVDQSQADIYSGRIYAVGVDDTIMIKRVEKHPGRLALLSVNPAYDPVYITGSDAGGVRIIGRVVWVSRAL